MYLKCMNDNDSVHFRDDDACDDSVRDLLAYGYISCVSCVFRNILYLFIHPVSFLTSLSHFRDGRRRQKRRRRIPEEEGEDQVPLYL